MKPYILAACVALSACGSMPAPKTPAQAVYELSATYAAALDIVVACYHIPACSPPAVRVVVKPVVDKSRVLVRSAQNIARATDAKASDVSNAISAAVAAVGELTTITKTLGVN